ncbi:hypothetical protein PoB_003334500 [Plakobranchus ocellatus]|uniref:Uncharacterized protein n=1 Tax=Plakobranchus ocellatus TaxID=259542 RepID=A0AAV4AJ47_9GAST|nr:hypothetical protein PoB_003334500 [Plakobranchus ocellatus]
MLLGPPSGRGAYDGAGTRDRRDPADLRADPQATVPPTSVLELTKYEREDKRRQRWGENKNEDDGKRRRVMVETSHRWANVFGHRITKGQLSAIELDEISGIAAGCVLSDIVSAHNYERDGNLLYSVDVNAV